MSVRNRIVALVERFPHERCQRVWFKFRRSHEFKGLCFSCYCLVNADENSAFPRYWVAVVWKIYVGNWKLPSIILAFWVEYAEFLSVMAWMNVRNKYLEWSDEVELVYDCMLDFPKISDMVLFGKLLRVNEVAMDLGSIASCADVIEHCFSGGKHISAVCSL